MNLQSQAPLISIITPIYNCEKYLEESILSVVNQTDSAWELILVDDGSTDHSGVICDKYNNDSNIRVIHQQNMGELRSRMNGVAIAKGEYILGLDADDYLAPECIEILNQAIVESKADLIWFKLQLVGGGNEICGCSLEPDCTYSQREIITEVITTTNHSLCNKAIKREMFNQNAYEDLNEAVRFNLDYAQIMPVLCNINNGYVIDNILYNYRIHDESISHTNGIPQIIDTGYVTEFIINKMENSALPANLWKAPIWNAYLKMTGNRLIEMLVYQTISHDECQKIHELDAYIESKKYETLKNMDFPRWVSLKLFRYKQYGLWKILAAYERRKLQKF